MTVNITGGNIPCTGNIQITYTDAAGAGTVTGSLTDTNTGTVTSFNLTLDDSLGMAGSIAVRENNATVTLSGITGAMPQDLACNVSVSPAGITGAGTINAFTGNFAMNFKTAAGAATAGMDQSGNLALNYADGKTETVTNPAGAPLTTGTGGTGSIPAYQTPIYVADSNRPTQMQTRSANLAGSVNASGQFLVRNIFSPSLEYSASSLGSPTTLPAGFIPTGLTNSGVITGWNGAYLPSASSAQQMLQAPGFLPLWDRVLTTDAGVFISVSGYDYNAPGPGNVLAWTSPASPPQVVQTPSGVKIVRLDSIAPGGAFVGTSDSTGPLYWSSYTAIPTVLTVPDSIHTGVGGLSISDGGHIAGTASAPLYWSSPTATAIILPGFGYLSSISVNGVNSAGVVVGTSVVPNIYPLGPSTETAVRWVNGKIEDLNMVIPSGGPWLLEEAVSINDAGWITGYGTLNGKESIFLLKPNS